MTPIEQAKALAAYWREQIPLFALFDELAEYKARETAEVLEQLVAELERP